MRTFLVMPDTAATTPGVLFDLREIFRRRLLAGLTQAELADLAGISNSQVSRIEKGKSGAAPDTLRRLAEALGCEIADFERPRIPA